MREGVLHCFDEQELKLLRDGLESLVSMETKKEGGGDRDVMYFTERCIRRIKGEPEVVEQFRVNLSTEKVVEHERVAL